MNDTRSSRLVDLQAIAREIMQQNGFTPGFPAAVEQQVTDLKDHPPQIEPTPEIKDLRSLLWSSIDNDTSRDLDQIEVAERLASGEFRVSIGIADVDACVPRNSPMDAFAANQTATIYAGVQNYSMLP